MIGLQTDVCMNGKISLELFIQFLQFFQPRFTTLQCQIIFHSLVLLSPDKDKNHLLDDIPFTDAISKDINIFQWLQLVNFLQVHFITDSDNDTNGINQYQNRISFYFIRTIKSKIYTYYIYSIIGFIYILILISLSLHPHILNILTLRCILIISILELIIRTIIQRYLYTPRKYFILEYFTLIFTILSCIPVSSSNTTDDNSIKYIGNFISKDANIYTIYCWQLVRGITFFQFIENHHTFKLIKETLNELYPVLRSLSIILFSIFYFFAMLGVSLFRNVIDRNTTDPEFLQTYYAQNNYWENNFDTLPHALVVLFEIMIINNWNLIVEGFVVATKTYYTRWFFIIFLFIVIIMMDVIVAMILKTFIEKYYVVKTKKTNTAIINTNNNNNNTISKDIYISTNNKQMQLYKELYNDNNIIHNIKTSINILAQSIHRYSQYQHHLIDKSTNLSLPSVRDSITTNNSHFSIQLYSENQHRYSVIFNPPSEDFGSNSEISVSCVMETEPLLE